MCSGVVAVRRSCPASSNSTRCAGSSLRRAASVAPAEPPPMMIVSYSCSVTSGHFCCLRSFEGESRSMRGTRRRALCRQGLSIPDAAHHIPWTRRQQLSAAVAHRVAVTVVGSGRAHLNKKFKIGLSQRRSSRLAQISIGWRLSGFDDLVKTMLSAPHRNRHSLAMAV
jgi:hypothetical protein